MIMFKVGNTDYTSHITSEKEYKVEEKDIVYKWTDGFGGSHENVYNTQVQGAFNMFFASANGADFTNFLAALESNKQTNGSLLCTLFIVNKNVEKQVHVNYTISNKKFAELNGVRGFVVTVEVREEAVYA